MRNAGECLSEEDVAELLDAGPSERAGRVWSHVDRCDACRKLLAATARSLLEEEHPLVGVAGLARYELTGIVGRGAMGVVYRARDRKLDRDVALKLFSPKTQDRAAFLELQHRVHAEARAMARLRHPNVVAVHDAGVEGTSLYIAMDLFEGSTLTRWLTDKDRSARDVVTAFVQAGRGLVAAHAEGVIHRDFKPDNVLVDPDGRVAVADFGLSRLATDARGPVRLVGTPAYMAPECLRGGEADARADQFSFCASLRQALTDSPRPPEPVATDDAALRAMKLPRRIRRAIVRGLAPQPENRFDRMNDLVAVLETGFAPRVRKRTLLLVALSLAATVSALVVWRRSRAETITPAELEAACADDAASVCGYVTPGEGRVALCLYERRARVSRRCLDASKRSLTTYVTLCMADQTRFCQNVPTGEGRVGRCLLAHGDALSAPCKAYLDAAWK